MQSSVKFSNTQSLEISIGFLTSTDYMGILLFPKRDDENRVLYVTDVWRSLVFPEAFAWHFFHCIANALCYCRYGTNDPKFGLLAERGWHQLYHQDMKMDNVLMTAIDYESHRLYPCHKLADFGENPFIGFRFARWANYFHRPSMQHRKNRSR